VIGWTYFILDDLGSQFSGLSNIKSSSQVKLGINIIKSSQVTIVKIDEEVIEVGNQDQLLFLFLLVSFLFCFWIYYLVFSSSDSILAAQSEIIDIAAPSFRTIKKSNNTNTHSSFIYIYIKKSNQRVLFLFLISRGGRGGYSFYFRFKIQEAESLTGPWS
jgi:hypothetical protein